MKLLEELKKTILGMGPLRRAWLTTFNLDIEFVETYVLPALIGADQPRKRHEYEQLQQELVEKQIDFRIFCDPRFLNTNGIKRTCVPVHAIRPDRLAGFGEASLFHPKVIYLEDAKGQQVVGAGSANLTTSGWGRNVEAFALKEIDTVINYHSVRDFFRKILVAADLTDERLSLRAPRNFNATGETWKFVHSLQAKSFLAQLLDGCKGSDLAVWSPYLPSDLASFVQKLIAKTTVSKVHLVPDRMDGHKPRTVWTEALGEITSDGYLTIYDRPTQHDPRAEFCHAKVWKIGERTAIGSWNFTGPGSNFSPENKGKTRTEHNVEAGLIIYDHKDWRGALGKSLDLAPEDYLSPEQFEEEDLDAPKLPPFDLHIYFDWRSLAYTFAGKWLTTGKRDGYEVHLPGVHRHVPLNWKSNGDTIQPGPMQIDESALVRDRVYRVFEGNTEVARGLICEWNLEHRRAQQFDSLNDLLEALIHGDDLKSRNDLTFRGAAESDPLPEDVSNKQATGNDSSDKDAADRNAVTYYRLFKAMQDYAAKIDKLEKLEHLEKLVFTVPGCVHELVQKVREANQKDNSPVFKWFLASEILSLCRHAEGMRRKLVRGSKDREKNYTPVPKSRWDTLSISVPELPRDVLPAYIELIRERCGYV